MLKYNLSQLDTISKKISSFLSKSDCIFLFGELGSGKTTFVRSLIHQLQEKNKINKTEVSSPTYNLLHEYTIKSLNILHYDLYRLKKTKEIDQLGIFQDENEVIKIIEWPSVIKIPKSDKLEIHLDYAKQDNERKLKLSGTGKWKNFK